MHGRLITEDAEDAKGRREGSMGLPRFSGQLGISFWRIFIPPPPEGPEAPKARGAHERAYAAATRSRSSKRIGEI